MRKRWVWCSRCQRCYETEVPDSDDPEAGARELGQLRGEDAARFWQCPYDDCGGTRIDAVPWIEVRQAHPGYPETPERDKAYHHEGLA